MKEQNMRWLKRLTAVTGAMALGLLGLAAPAAAQQNLDPTETGSITIHKFEEPETTTGLLNDGTLLDDAETAALAPLEGVEFTVQRVDGYDLTTAEDWDAIEGMTLTDLADENLVEIGSATTSQNGQAVFEELDLGLYLVTETGHGDNLISNSAAPFLVTIPMPHTEQGWLYDVHAYPKNSVTSIGKTLDDSNAYGLGETITWTVTADIPQLPEGESFTEFVMTDELVDALQYQEVRVTLGEQTVPNGNYSTDFNEAANTLTVSFTDPGGLAYLGDNQGETVSFEIDTAVVGIGTINNVANFQINDSGTFSTDPIETSAWGALDIFKFTGDAEAPDALSGAEFQIFTSEEDASNLANAVAVNGEQTFTSDNAGIAALAGLKAGNYWVVETQAPAGYIGKSAPMPITIEADTTAVLEVENDQRGAFGLPLTGGMGTTVFILVGLAVVALAVGLGVRHQRAKQRTA